MEWLIKTYTAVSFVIQHLYTRIYYEKKWSEDNEVPLLSLATDKICSNFPNESLVPIYTEHLRLKHGTAGNTLRATQRLISKYLVVHNYKKTN